MKSSFHSLVPFLPLFWNCQLNSIPSSSPGRLASRTRLCSRLDYSSILPNTFKWLCTDQAQNTASVVKEACLLIHCLAMGVILLRALAPAGRCLPNRCLAICIHVTVLIIVFSSGNLFIIKYSFIQYVISFDLKCPLALLVTNQKRTVAYNVMSFHCKFMLFV
jgi:hypothetical protein